MPSNDTPQTATPITSLPYSITQDPGLAGVTTYESSCAVRFNAPLWFTYTTSATETALGITFTSSNPAGDYYPSLSIWTGTLPGLTEVTPFCASWSGTAMYTQIAVSANTTYYFLFVNNSTPGVPGSLVFTLSPPTADPVPAGSLLVSNDTDAFPAVLLSASDGSVLKVFGWPAFEQAATLPSGKVCVAALDAMFFVESFNIYAATLALITSNTSLIVASYTNLSPVSHDGTSTFYVSRVDNTNPAKITQLSDAGVVGTTRTLPSDSAHMTAMVYAASSSIVYYGTDQDSAIHRFDWAGNAPLSDLVADGGGTSIIGRDMELDASGNILVMYAIDNTTTAWEVRRYNTSGSLLTTYDVGTVSAFNAVPRMRRDPTSSNVLWVMSEPTNGTSRFQSFNITSGAQISTFDVAQKNAAEYTTPLYGPSQSCPLLMNVSSISGACPVMTAVTQPRCKYASPQSITITGSGFPDPPTVTITDPNGDALAFTLVSNTSTEIVVTAVFTLCGTYTFTCAGTGACGDASLSLATYQTFSTRRLRRFPHVSEQQVWLFWRSLQIDIEAGRALASGLGDDPQIMLRWSDDGGHTWSTEQWRSAGLRGQYTTRPRWMQLGRSRDRVYELVVSDPVPWVFLQALAVIEKGVS